MNVKILVGTIASGKSTYAARMAEKGYLIVNDDTIVTSLHGRNNLYTESLKGIYRAIEMNIIAACLSNNMSLVIDAPNVKRESRLRYRSIAKSFGATVDVVIFPFDKPEVNAARRFEKDSRGYSYEKWLNVANLMYSNFQPLEASLEEYDGVEFI